MMGLPVGKTCFPRDLFVIMDEPVYRDRSDAHSMAHPIMGENTSFEMMPRFMNAMPGEHMFMMLKVIVPRHAELNGNDKIF
jgi:hypothetical protein